MAIFKFETGTTYTLRLKYKSALEKPGKWGIQFLYTLSTGEVMFVPPIAHEAIQALHVGQDEPFLLTKKSEGSRTVWVIERVPQPPAPPVRAEAAPPEKKPASRAELLTELGTVLMTGTDGPLPTPAPALNLNSAPIDSRTPRSIGQSVAPKSITDGQKQYYLSRAEALIDVFAAANKYAAERHAGSVTKDDVRSLVLSIYIQCAPKPGQRSY
jgi:hypothetical protein